MIIKSGESATAPLFSNELYSEEENMKDIFKAICKPEVIGLIAASIGLFVAEAIVGAKLEEAAGNALFEERFNQLYDKRMKEDK